MVLQTRSEDRVRVLNDLAQNDPRGAETALGDLAEKEGEGALLDLMEQSSPLSLANILSAHDASRETILSYLVTPEQIARTLAMEPARWQKIKEEEIGSTIRQMEDLIISLLINREETERREVIEAIRREELAFTSLLVSLFRADFHNLPEDLFEVKINTPEMIWWWIYSASPEIAEEICNIFLERRINPYQEIVSLREEALAHLQEEAEQKIKEADMFQPL
ncbi:MAG TPA: hypothetical protein VKO42_02115 [Patescibacteria group bacterium]|nr:hypothetical protein [Patescibacteria group bacterium]